MRQTLKLSDMAFLAGVSATGAAPSTPILPVTENRLLHWDTSDLTTLFTDSARTTPAVLNDYVGGITDLSGTSNHATQPTDAERPQLVSGSGRTILYFELGGADAWLPFTTDLTTIRTVFAVLSNDSTTRRTILGGTTDYDFFAGDGGVLFDQTFSSTNIGTIHIDSSAYTRATAPYIPTNHPTFHMLSIQSSGSLKASRFGKDRADNGGIRWTRGLGELILYSTALSAGDVTSVENYLKTKWGTP
jgi:hypothetical protein